jgi:hypothetical protein
VLAIATFASVRSANRSARVAELALQEQRRPLLVNSRDDDRSQTVGFHDLHRMSIAGGSAVVDVAEEAVYLAMSLRNAGVGIAVLQAWRAQDTVTVQGPEPPLDEFRPLARDQYIAGGDIGVWQAAIRDPADPLYVVLSAAATERRVFVVDLLYTDQVGGQRTISRMGIQPSDDRNWRGTAARHWYLDAPSPR